MEIRELVEDWGRERDCESVALALPLERTTVHEYYAERGFER